MISISILTNVTTGAAQRGIAWKLDVAPHEHQVSCDWWRAGHVTTELVSDWSTSHGHQRGVV